jgi:hypothetical protein
MVTGKKKKGKIHGETEVGERARRTDGKEDRA